MAVRLRMGLVVLASAGLVVGLAGGTVGQEGMQALTVLPPGNSMHYTLDGFVTGTLTGDPHDFGDNVFDQVDLYWGYDFKDGGFRDECEDPDEPLSGVRVCWDEFGIPAVYADTEPDAWYGAGWAAASQRLFLMDAIRRTARGTLAELTGPGSVPEDVATRILTYTESEYEAMFAAVSPEARAIAESHIAGINDRIAAFLLDPSDLPAEYALLTAEPEPFTLTDIAAMGVLMTRNVASEGGNEFVNVRALRAYEDAFGVDDGRAAFEDLVWVEDAEATVTVPREEGVFPRTSASPAERAAAFHAMADFASTLPLELESGSGTGDHPRPTTPLDDVLALLDGASLSGPSVPAGMDAEAVRDMVASVPQAIEAWRNFRGGSFSVAIAPHKTADGSALLMSEPQLGYNPTLLWEVEIHAGDTVARGSTVPGLPIVGIGYTPDTAWALTTGNGKTIDSFIETVRDGDDGPEYLHDGTWQPMDCHTESVAYRGEVEGVPVGPAGFDEDVEVCRTVHGPVVAWSDDGTQVRTVQYAMRDRELENFDALLDWGRARTFDEFEAAMRRVTWNENTIYADADGRIAFWHPGLHHRRHPGTDLRLPIPGTGEFDHDGFLAFEELPHAVDPAQGFLANWNNKPAHGWLDGEGIMFQSYPAARGQRVTNITHELAAHDDWTFERLRDLDRIAASRDMRATELLPLLLDLQSLPDLEDLESQALGVLAAWDRSANGPGADEQFTMGETATVGAAWTVFDRVAKDLVDVLLGELDLEGNDLFSRQSRVSAGHPYDVAPAFALAVRVLDPDSSSLEPSRDYLDGRTAEDVLRDTLQQALEELRDEQDTDDVSAWRTAYPMTSVCSATGVIGPCVEMPFLERGTWIHFVGFAQAGTPAGPETPPPPAPLPTTGGGLALAALALALLSATLRRGRSSHLVSRPVDGGAAAAVGVKGLSRRIPSKRLPWRGQVS